MISVNFQNKTKRSYKAEKIKEIFKQVLAAASSVVKRDDLIHGFTINIVFIPEKQSALLNKKYRKKTSASESLVFVYKEDKDVDLLIVPRLVRTKYLKDSFDAALLKTFVHSLLHILDIHHRSKSEYQDMWNIQESVYDQLKISS